MLSSESRWPSPGNENLVQIKFGRFDGDVKTVNFIDRPFLQPSISFFPISAQKNSVLSSSKCCTRVMRGLPESRLASGRGIMGRGLGGIIVRFLPCVKYILPTTIIVWVVKWGTVSATGQRKETELLNGN